MPDEQRECEGGRLDAVEAERRALDVVRALLASSGGDPGPMDEVEDELGVIDYQALEDVVMALGQLALQFGAELHGVDRFGDVLTALEVERAGRAETSAAGDAYVPRLTAVDVPGGQR